MNDADGDLTFIYLWRIRNGKKRDSGRPWTWTPPPAMNWMMATTLRLPLLHRLVSKMLLLIAFTGRKSGKHYVIPVGYHRNGNMITILTKHFRKWWHNFESHAPVVVRIEGRNYTGQAAALTDTATMIPIIAHLVEANPGEAEIYQIKLLDNGKPDLDSVRELAPKVVIIQVTLHPEQGLKAQQVWVERLGRAEVLTLVAVEVSPLQPNDVCIEVEASGGGRSRSYVKVVPVTGASRVALTRPASS